MTPRQIQEMAARFGYQQHHHQPLVIPDPPASKVGATTRRKLQWHLDARGALVELHRTSWAGWCPDLAAQPEEHPGNVGQVYISTTLPGVIKGWHLHAHQTDRFVCLRGRLLLATCDLRSTDPLATVTTQVLEPMRGQSVVEVPPGVAHGWRAMGDSEAWVLNLCSHEYDGTDEWRKDPHADPRDGAKPRSGWSWAMGVDG